MPSHLKHNVIERHGVAACEANCAAIKQMLEAQTPAKAALEPPRTNPPGDAATPGFTVGAGDFPAATFAGGGPHDGLAPSKDPRSAPTTLHDACAAGDLAAVARLVRGLRTPADVDAVDEEKRSPLWRACRGGHEAVARWLVTDAAADPGTAAVAWARSDDPAVELHKQIFSALSLCVGPLHAACARGGVAGVAALLTPEFFGHHKSHCAEHAPGAESDADLRGMAVRAAAQGLARLDAPMKAKCGQSFAEHVADSRGAPLVERRNRHGATPLNAAAAAGQLEVVRWLARGHGADLAATKTESSAGS